MRLFAPFSFFGSRLRSALRSLRSLRSDRVGYASAAFAARRTLLAFVAFSAALPATVVHAQGDLVWSQRVFEVPDPPADFERAEGGDPDQGTVVWDYPDVARDEVARFRRALPAAWAALEADLGVDVDDSLRVRVARTPEEMEALAPRGLGVPEYAVGVAYPHLGVIILCLDAPGSWEPPNLDEVFVHELSHVALRRAVGGAELPRWFVEGMAIHHAEERSLERFQTLWYAHLQDEVLPLHMIDGRFPPRVHEVSLAYAESADVVTFLRREEHGTTKMHRLIREISEGNSFEEALLEAYSMSPQTLEREWLRGLEERMSSVPMVLGGGTFWVLAALLLVVAWRRRRQQARTKLAAMEREEAVQEEALARLEQLVDAQLQASEGRERAGAVSILVTDDPPQGREAGVPTVQVDGQNHTLH